MSEAEETLINLIHLVQKELVNELVLHSGFMSPNISRVETLSKSIENLYSALESSHHCKL